MADQAPPNGNDAEEKLEPNPEHLEILRSGVEEWNQWRQENPDITPVLRHADLRGANLRHADLKGANVYGVHNPQGGFLSNAVHKLGAVCFEDLRGVKTLAA